MKRTCLAVALLLLAGCGEPRRSEQTSGKVSREFKGPPYVLAVLPTETAEKTAFNKQPDGASALSVTGKGFDPRAVITANGRKLPTAFGNNGWLTAKMPGELYERAGVVTINVINSNGKTSNPVDFKVTAAK